MSIRPPRNVLLSNSDTRRNREECTRLLTLLVSATQRLIKPYALPMLRVLLPKASDGNPIVAANVLMCLGELACVGGEDAMPHVPELMQIILTRLSDSSTVKRDAALHTLGQVCSSTGYVITPLVDHPQLLPLLGRILRIESDPAVRREVVKVLGILGALDPFRRKVDANLLSLSCEYSWNWQSRPEEETAGESAMAAVNQVPIAQHVAVSGSDDYFQTVVITSLLAILKDQALSSHHHTVIEAIMSIFKTQGLKCVTFLPQVLYGWGCVILFLIFFFGRSYPHLPQSLVDPQLGCKNSIYNSLLSWSALSSNMFAIT